MAHKSFANYYQPFTWIIQTDSLHPRGHRGLPSLVTGGLDPVRHPICAPSNKANLTTHGHKVPTKMVTYNLENFSSFLCTPFTWAPAIRLVSEKGKDTHGHKRSLPHPVWQKLRTPTHTLTHTYIYIFQRTCSLHQKQMELERTHQVYWERGKKKEQEGEEGWCGAEAEEGAPLCFSTDVWTKAWSNCQARSLGCLLLLYL